MPRLQVKLTTPTLRVVRPANRNAKDTETYYGLTHLYSKDVVTNIGKTFLQFIDKHFPKSSRLYIRSLTAIQSKLVTAA